MNKIYTIFLLLIIFISAQLTTAQVATLQSTLELKQINDIKVPFQNGIPLPSFEKQKRTILDLAGNWKKERFNSDVQRTLSQRNESTVQNLTNESSGKTESSFDDSAWENIELPAVENKMNLFPNRPEYYQSGVLYRKNFTVPDSLTDKFVKLIFYSANYVADIWINSEYIGYHEGGYTPFAFNVSDKIKVNEENTIVVRVDNPAWGSRNDIVPFTQCDWFNYTGIIHDVYLEFSENVSVVRTDVVPLNLNGELKLKSVFFNNTAQTKNVKVSYQIFEAEVNDNNIQSEYSEDLVGNEVDFSGEKNFEFEIDSVYAFENIVTISNPKLWSQAHSNLYILKVTVIEQDSLVDEYFTQFGVRTIKTDGNKILLNNRIVFLTGVARHEDHPQFGRSVPKDVIYSDLLKVKSVNSNFLRTAHYPNNPYTYLITDRLRITVMHEIPVFWFDTVEPWNIQNNFRKIHYQMFREMVFKDYNRPSIIMWSTSNESKEVTNRLVYNQTLVDDIKNNFYDGRLITQSSAGDKPGPTDATQTPLDVAGWTLYFGIFHGSTYFTGTFGFLNNARTNFPNKPIIDTEFGYWSSENGSTTQKQVDVFNETFKAFRIFTSLNQDGSLNQNGNLMATTWWCIFDWYTHTLPNGFQSMGLMSMDRGTEKPVAGVLRNTYLPFYLNEGILTATEDDEILSPEEFILYQNYPNPFNPETQINFSLPTGSFVKLSVFDILGREVAKLVNEYKDKGNYSIKFIPEKINAGLASGLYLYQLKTGDFSTTKKMVYIK